MNTGFSGMGDNMLRSASFLPIAMRPKAFRGVRRLLFHALFMCVFIGVSRSPVLSASDEGRSVRLQAIALLGELNGTALSCGYLDQTRRMKEAIIQNAPKERLYGFTFDKASNDGYLAFIRDDRVCPSLDSFVQSVDGQIAVLSAAFATQ